MRVAASRGPSQLASGAFADDGLRTVEPKLSSCAPDAGHPRFFRGLARRRCARAWRAAAAALRRTPTTTAERARRPRARGRPRGLHRRAVQHQSGGHDRADRRGLHHRGLHHPPGRLRPAQAARQAAGRQAPGRTRRYQVPEAAARTIAALLTIRDQGRSTIPCLCGGWCGGEAEVLEKGVHVDAQSLVVAVDPGPGGRWAAPPRGADSGEARRDDPGRSPRR